MPAEDITAVMQLVQRERESRDRQWWKEMSEAYDPEARIRVSWYDGNPQGFIEHSRKIAQAGNKSLHHLQPITVRVNGDRAVATLGCHMESQVEADIFGTEAVVEIYVRLVYTAQRKQSEWKLMSLNCIYERDSVTPIIPGTSLTINTAVLSKYRSSYRFLSYTLEKKGHTSNQELAGDGSVSRNAYWRNAKLNRSS